VELDEKRGKGSHVTVIVNGRRTIVQYGDLTPKRIRTILRQLRLPTDALE
jgi:predicted RNA binding protein YcfA (HicA-like mRNA interferase family)